MKTKIEISPANSEGNAMPPANSVMPAIATAAVPRIGTDVCATLSRRRGTAPAVPVTWRSSALAKGQEAEQVASQPRQLSAGQLRR